MDKMIKDTLDKMTRDYNKNILLLKKCFLSLDYTDYFDNTIYHLIMKCNSSDEKKLIAIVTLLKYGIDPNKKNNNGDTFLHTAIRERIEPTLFEYILKSFNKFNIKYDFNARDLNGNNLFHLIIKCFPMEQDIKKFAIILKKYNFDFFGTDVYNKTAFDLLDFRWGLSDEGVDEIKKIIKNGDIKKEDKVLNMDEGNMVSETVDNPKYGTILTNKEYEDSQAIGRDDEINKLYVSLATKKKLPILVGPSGVGKTSIVDEISFRIKKGIVPNFLKDRIIYEVHMSSILAGTRYRGSFEENMKEVLDYAINNNAIIFMDEFHMVFGAGSCESDKTDAASIIKTYIDRYNVEIIGATTELEYEEYIAHDALKRRFDVIKINELSEEKLHNIAMNSFNALSMTNVIEIDEVLDVNLDIVINILLLLTSNKNRVYDDKVYNPDLILSIIDRAFAYVVVDNDDTLRIKHLIMSIMDNERIYNSAKEIAIRDLNNIDLIKNNLKKKKIIKFSDYKKEHSYY